MKLILQVMGVLISLQNSLNLEDPEASYVLRVSTYSIVSFFEIFQKGERKKKGTMNFLFFFLYDLLCRH
jgi:hypothetical protein